MKFSVLLTTCTACSYKYFSFSKHNDRLNHNILIPTCLVLQNKEIIY